jgi:hypothetical protein
MLSTFRFSISSRLSLIFFPFRRRISTVLFSVFFPVFASLLTQSTPTLSAFACPLTRPLLCFRSPALIGATRTANVRRINDYCRSDKRSYSDLFRSKRREIQGSGQSSSSPGIGINNFRSSAIIADDEKRHRTMIADIKSCQEASACQRRIRRVYCIRQLRLSMLYRMSAMRAKRVHQRPLLRLLQCGGQNFIIVGKTVKSRR